MLTALLGASVFSATHQLPTEDQTAEAVLIVHPGGTADTGTTRSDYWHDAAEAVEAAPVVSAVRLTLKSSDDLGQIRRRIEAAGDPQSGQVVVRVRADEARRAVALANSLAAQVTFFLRDKAIANLRAPDLAAKGNGVTSDVARDLRARQRRLRIARALDEDRYAVSGPAVATGTFDRNTAQWALIGALLGAVVGGLAAASAAGVRRRQQQAQGHPHT